MLALWLFFEAQPGWAWLGLAAALLAGELLTGSGYLLWPSASAGLVGLISLLVPGLPLAAQVVIFAALTIASTYAARRWLPRRDAASAPDEVDINDLRRRLIGHEGEGVAQPGSIVGDGRVLVDGKEWSAELETGGAPTAGQRVRVVALLGGARLKVAAI